LLLLPQLLLQTCIGRTGFTHSAAAEAEFGGGEASDDESNDTYSSNNSVYSISDGTVKAIVQDAQRRGKIVVAERPLVAAANTKAKTKKSNTSCSSANVFAGSSSAPDVGVVIAAGELTGSPGRKARRRAKKAAKKAQAASEAAAAAAEAAALEQDEDTAAYV
jgi:hypothetical protein